MVLSVYPIGEMREIEPPSDGKGSGAVCAVLDINGERAPACSLHLDEVDPKVRNAEGEVVFSAEPAHRLHLCIPPDRGGPGPGAAPHRRGSFPGKRGIEERRMTRILCAARRNEVSFKDWMKMDLAYIDNWSLGLDFKILARTALVVVLGYGR
jgi:hypothetical protein